MIDYSKIRADQEVKLLKALEHLRYTYKKIQSLTEDCTAMNEEDLETWESFASRFARVSDIFLARYLRTRVLEADPGFSGTFRDFLLKSEKMQLIDDTNKWLAIRELKNLSAHEYVEEGLTKFFHTLKIHTSDLLSIPVAFTK